MKAKLLFLFLLAALLAGCGKDKYTTKPQIEIKSVKIADVVTQGGSPATIYEFNLAVRDKEGNAQGEIIIDKLDAPLPACQLNGGFSETYAIPTFPGEPNQEVIVKVKYSDPNSNLTGYRTLGATSCTSPSQPHIAIFKFRVVDKAGDTSNAVQTDPITLPF